MIYSYCLQCEKGNQNGYHSVKFLQLDYAKRFICLTQTSLSDPQRSQLQTRLLAVEARIAALSKSAVNSQNTAGRDLQQQLASSQVFSTSLRRVQATATANLRRLEEYLGERIVQSQKRFAEVEEKLIGMMVQKEKVLRNMNFTLENQGHSIAALELWANADHSQNQSLSLLEEALRSRLEASQRNHQLQLETIQQRIDSLQQSRSSATAVRQRQTEERLEDQNQWDRQMGALKRQLAELGTKIQQKKEDTKNDKLAEKLIEDLSFKLHTQNTKIQNLESQTRELSRSFAQFKEERERQKIKQENSLSLKKEFQMAPSLRSERKYSESKKSEKEEVITPPKQAKQSKPLPPRKPPLIPEPSFFETEPEIKDMRGGIRGLLQKSKEKDRQQLSKSNSKKPLPPVRQDPLARKKKQQPKPKPVEPEAVVYQIDEQGYLMDEQGNYLVGQDGQMIRLSQSEIQQYMMDEGQ